MKRLESKPCQICGCSVAGIRRKDRKSFIYPDRCQECKGTQRLTDDSRTRKAHWGPNNPQWVPVGTRTLHASRKGGPYYWRVKLPDGSWEYEQRVVAAKALGRRLTRKEHAHHKNENTLDNSDDNLAVLDCGAHTRLHLAITSWSRLYSCCVVCGESDRKHASHGKCTRCNQRKIRLA